METIKKTPPTTSIHYYGTINSINDNNDVAFLTRGSIYYLRDKKQSDENQTVFHPYLVLQDSYLDKVGKITVFGITSSPININMIPIIIKGCIGYIDPYNPDTHNIREFMERKSNYVGSIVNPVVLDLVGDIYGMTLGLNLSKTYDEIIDSYMKYIEDFKVRSANICRYKSKKLPDRSMYTDELELNVSFSYNYLAQNQNNIGSVFECESNNEVDDSIDNAIKTNYTEVQPKETGDKVIKTRKTSKTKSEEKDDNKVLIEIDLGSQALLSAISSLESEPHGKVKLPKLAKITIDDIKIFYAYKRLYGLKQTSLLYNCSVPSISARTTALNKLYTIKFI